MSDQNTEEKNQTVDKGSSDGVALDSVATHLSKAIDRLNSAEEQLNPHRFNQPDTFAIVSAAHSLIALTQIFSYQTNSLPTTSPRSNSAAAYSPEPDTDSQSQPTEDQSVHSATGASQPLAENHEPNPNPYAQYDTKTLKEHRDFLVQSDLSNPQSVAWVEAEAARRESESFQTRNQAGDNWLGRLKSTPFENPDVELNEPITNLLQYHSDKIAHLIRLWRDSGLDHNFQSVNLEYAYQQALLRESQGKTYTFTRDELVDFCSETFFHTREWVEIKVDSFLDRRQS